MESQRHNFLKPEHPNSSLESMGYKEEFFTGKNPEEKIAEVYSFAEKLGLSPKNALIRMFNSGFNNLVRQYGTDRAGVEINKLRYIPYDDEYSEKLTSLGLQPEDGLYAIPLQHWAPNFTAGLFQHETMEIPPHRIAISIYDARKMLHINTDEPASTNSQGEFFYFSNPKHKKDALAGTLLQEPLEIEKKFDTLPDNQSKVFFLKKQIQFLKRENILIYQEMIADTKRNIFKSEDSKGASSSLRKDVAELSDTCRTVKKQFSFIDNWREHIKALRRSGTRNNGGTSVDFIVQHIRKELADDSISDFYREELLGLVSEAENLPAKG